MAEEKKKLEEQKKEREQEKKEREEAREARKAKFAECKKKVDFLQYQQGSRITIFEFVVL